MRVWLKRQNQSQPFKWRVVQQYPTVRSFRFCFVFIWITDNRWRCFHHTSSDSAVCDSFISLHLNEPPKHGLGHETLAFFVSKKKVLFCDCKTQLRLCAKGVWDLRLLYKIWMAKSQGNKNVFTTIERVHIIARDSMKFLCHAKFWFDCLVISTPDFSLLLMFNLPLCTNKNILGDADRR